ncbi:RNA-directed RNA polymerase [ssRNA phage SRR6960799_20]|uniref:RNA-directed RNA polymerase n=1 Tax=ssRNA phage SRR6960799_20 TaxID=2786577 RepID=A0A8S5L4N6_9VIRU|nr:RNA-directed RNA polymerase [ssRNA phage SRR6960799_20]DAD52311.1 TPA_asm: RNA-directed RNA polymerase [ssRNA phage SRR6960799_20]
MRPTKTCHVLRALLKAVGSEAQIDEVGLYAKAPDMPSVMLPSVSFRDAWFAYNLARKREVDRPETEEAARAAFYDSEARCATIEKDGILSSLDWLARNTLIRASQIAAEVLGVKPPSSWYQECSFTGGASTSRSRSDSHPALKWWASPSLHVTPLALRHLLALKASCEVLDVAWEDPGILSSETYSHDRSFYKIVPGSRLEFVEKNYKTKRAILIEPDGNMVLQKGVGNIIRKQLKRVVNIDLDDQTRNQRLAFAGSVSGSLGTIDLSAASDSVSLALLRILLPWKWYELIYELRSPCYLDGDIWRTMRKVSSMGNGFTFELESLVFYCLTQAVVDVLKPKETRVGIFGDDIIVATSVCGALESVLNRCGFSLNQEKSFWRGPFRESCGKHFHNGLDVTPVYCKADLDDASEVYRLYNQVRLWARQGCNFDFDERFNAPLRTISGLLAKADRIQIPLEYGPNEGLYFPDVCHHRLRFYRNKRGHDLIAFYRRAPKRLDLTDRFDSECGWLYRHMERWTPSCPLGIGEYTSLSLVREGKLERVPVVIPASSITWPIP